MAGKKKLTTKNMVLCAAFAAILCVLGPVSLPIGPVPVTLHTFIVALTSYVIGGAYGAVSTLIYLVIGVIGVPVFSGYTAGLSHIVGVTGGYLYGFVVMAFLCGVKKFTEDKETKVAFIIYLIQGLVGLAMVYLLGTIQYCLITKNSVVAALSVCVLPFALKDVISVVIALILGMIIRKALYKARILEK